jgi:hypothetical protein
MSRFVDHPEYVSTGQAEVIFAELVEGALEPYRFIGITPKVELASMGEDVEEITDPRSSTGAVYKRIVKKRVPEFGLTLKAVTPQNRALVHFADLDELTQAATPVVDEALTGGVAVGAIYKLAHPNVNAAETFTLGTAEQTPVAFTLNTHFTLQADAGIVEIIALPVGVTAGDLLQASYTPTALVAGSGFSRMKTALKNRVEGRMMLLTGTGEGEKRMITIWKCSLTLDGSFPHVTENALEFGVKVTVLTDDAHDELWEDLQLAAPSA